MEKRIWTTVGVIFLIIIAAFLLKDGPIGEQEKAALARIEAGFAAGNESIALEEIAPFDWDYVCLNRGDALGNDVPFGITRDPIEQSKIAEHHTTLAFFKDKRLVETFGFRGSEVIRVGGNKFRVLINFEIRNCPNRASAQLATREDTHPHFGLLRKIVLTRNDIHK